MRETAATLAPDRFIHLRWLMNADELHRLGDIAWRRALTPAEEERLRDLLQGDPARQAAWGEELRLTRCLARLPDAPVSPNFAARVLRALDSETARPGLWERCRRGWLTYLPAPSPAWALALALLLPAGYWHHQSQQRGRIATSIARISLGVDGTAQALQTSPVEVLRDYEAIDHLRLAAAVDEDLLANLEAAAP